ncbi:hypothetical protein ERJ75_000256900 [Trypanosoma vivax]|nr:hypothetical protein TRVL_08715 [Trypanosoma vivax]KAH8618839.1 hypothetical protein ERJ75_000256900 [Trypanosoma vivax]
MFYDEAMGHQCLMERRLDFHGYRTSLVGAFRRGRPVAPCATFLLSVHSWGGDNVLDDNDEATRGHIFLARAVKGLQASGYVKEVRKRGIVLYDRSTLQYVWVVAPPPTLTGPPPFHLCNGSK